MLEKKQSIQFSFILFLIIFLFITLMLTAAVPDSLKERIRKAKYFDDIFKLEKKIKLVDPPDGFITKVKNLLVTEKRDFIAHIEGAGIHKVLRYSNVGKFRNPIGEAGYDKEDYYVAFSIAKDNEDNIYILDQPQSKILVYTADNVYKSSLKFASNGLYIHINSKNEIFLYSGVNTKTKRDCIYKYSQYGKEINEFAEYPEEITPDNYYAVGNTMGIDKKDFVYEVNPRWSNVRKYNSAGIFITEFGSKEVSKPTNADKIGVLKKGLRIVEAIFIIQDVIMLIYSDGKMDIYDLDGELLNQGIKINENIICSTENEIYTQSRKGDVNKVINKFVLK